MGQHLSYGPRYLATLTFDLEDHRTCRRYGSSCSVCVPTFKFFEVSRPSLSKIWHTFHLSVNRPGDLDLWLFDLETGALYCTWDGQPWYQLWYVWDFSFSSNGPTPVRRTTWPRDLNLWPWMTWRLSAIQVFVLRLNTKLEVVSLSVRKIWFTPGLSISRPGDLYLWPLTLKLVVPVRWVTFLPILEFLGRFILDLSANTCQTHHVTLRPWP